MSDFAVQRLVRRSFGEMAEQCKLLPLPAVVTTALKLLDTADGDTHKLCRILSDDAALVARLFGLARSPFYSRHCPPRTLQEAIQVLGLRSVRRVLVATTVQTLCLGHSGTSETLWNHSLATALAAEMLARQARFAEPEQAFLGGLLHDIGQMVFLHSRAAELRELQPPADTGPVMEWEKEMYGFDHVLVGAVLLDCWDFDAEIRSALLKHHEEPAESKLISLGTVLRVADYLSYAAGLGYLCELPPPPAAVLSSFACESDEALGKLTDQLQQAFAAEKALFS